MISDILGITLASPGYFELAHEAARRFRKYTGCDCLVITTDRPDSYDAKLALPNLGDRTLCFFDADLWFIRQVDLEPFRQINGVAAVREVGRHLPHSFCIHDCSVLDAPMDRHVNAGLMIINPRVQPVKSAFEIASQILADSKAGVNILKDYGEQSALNAGFHRAGVEMTFLDDAWNFWPKAWTWGCYDALPVKPFAIHAAGVKLHEKAQFLKDQCKVWEF